MPVAIDVGYLKVALQSAALSEGYGPADVAEAVRSMDIYKGAKGDIYISKRGHKILRFVVSFKDGSKSEFNYTNFDKAQVDAMPGNATPWQKFSSTEWQIESQAALKQPPASLDASRKAALGLMHDNLASYNAQKGFYPTLATINDLSWLATVALGAPEIQRDPLATATRLSAAPAPGVYSYTAAPISGAGACDNVTVPCGHYHLVATLSNGQQYIVIDP